LSYAIEILDSARKAIAALPKADRGRVDARIRGLSDEPRPQGAAPLKGTGRALWRVRAGDYRVIYRIEDSRLVVVVVHFGHRRDVYRGL
jgi:mRNA interferase RelE/StbE